MPTSKIAYVSGLKAGTRPIEVCQTLCPSASLAEVMSEIILHNEGAFFLAFEMHSPNHNTEFRWKAYV